MGFGSEKPKAKPADSCLLIDLPNIEESTPVPVEKKKRAPKKAEGNTQPCITDMFEKT